MECAATVERAPGGFLGAFDVEFFAGRDCRSDEYRLRYSVFVEEREWLAPSASCDGLERDEYDDYSLSFLLRDSQTGTPAACQRLILPDRLPSRLRSPFEALAEAQSLLGTFDRRLWAEVSRTTIAPQYRWGARDNPTPAMRAIKHASIALATAAARSTLFSVSDPRTARLVRRMGFHCHRIGDLVQYHGPRALYRMDMDDIQKSVPLGSREELVALTERARVVTRAAFREWRDHATDAIRASAASASNHAMMSRPQTR